MQDADRAIACSATAPISTVDGCRSTSAVCNRAVIAPIRRADSIRSARASLPSIHASTSSTYQSHPSSGSRQVRGDDGVNHPVTFVHTEERRHLVETGGRQMADQLHARMRCRDRRTQPFDHERLVDDHAQIGLIDRDGPLDGTTPTEQAFSQFDRGACCHARTVAMATFLFMPESAYGPTNNCIGIGDILRQQRSSCRLRRRGVVGRSAGAARVRRGSRRPRPAAAARRAANRQPASSGPTSSATPSRCSAPRRSISSAVSCSRPGRH